MKELKVLAVVVFFTLITYWGVEPYAHSVMHKHVEFEGFKYDGKADIEEVKAKIEKAKEEKQDTKKLEAKLKEKEKFWADVKKIASLKGDPKAGEALYGNCAGCHDAGVNMGGVIPPKLDHAGKLYSKEYLIALIKDPAMASNVDHKYQNTMTHPMGAVKSMITKDQDIANVVAYLKAKKSGEVTPKQAFEEACGRCHAMRYAKWTQVGEVPKTKPNIKTHTDLAMLKFEQKVAEQKEALAKYMGKLPPDLSIIVRARSEHFLKTFIENPQSQLPGTAMPRVGLNQEGYEKVYKYLEEVGDPSKPKREATGPWVLGFFVIFSFLAYLWYKSQWEGLK